MPRLILALILATLTACTTAPRAALWAEMDAAEAAGLAFVGPSMFCDDLAHEEMRAECEQ